MTIDDQMQSKRTLTSLLVGTQHIRICTEEGAIDNLSSNTLVAIPHGLAQQVSVFINDTGIGKI